MGILATTLFGATIACAINDVQQAVSPIRKTYKSLERQGQLIKMRNSLKAELENIEDKCYSEAREFELKWLALKTYLRLTHNTMRREELYAARQLKRNGNIGPAIAIAKRNAELQDILEDYFF